VRRGCCVPARPCPSNDRSPSRRSSTLRARLTLVALRAQEDGEVARGRGPSASGLGVPTVLSSRLSQRTTRRRPAAPPALSHCAKSERHSLRSIRGARRPASCRRRARPEQKSERRRRSRGREAVRGRVGGTGLGDAARLSRRTIERSTTPPQLHQRAL
jgi:hypothetical protein